ncbi:2-amino-4-hydroxy-6-hydroxymethyldihydropteridine diphosphokinase [Aestuariispira insulae]|uniref:2-amino-4-hydroxy-6-hydroxymethyldihydropteridine pyrophosphokinase n=1 Tax=Aestuariispira insulae TaxID=1461337 RepID=A0A3D9HTM2_9PROT|nr:2-amino-4-hydroxy-6-hydroxymethyldihydropteridine diphosphokinase [Aestuariispira insulae]RED52226.1 2-amino-4-hydroxy-6-hydroxymethyldihydropteridine diphosphokinase [Aestuariispira insulae]
MTDKPIDVFVALGTNMGERAENLETGIERLGELMTVTGRSRLYQSAPMYVTDQPAFLNMAVRGTTALTPEEFLDGLKRLEHEIGRRPTFRNGPRVIDLDILYYGDLLMDTERLNIPHPRIAERGFVLEPLRDLAPEWHDVRMGKTIAQMADDYGPEDGLEVFEG